MHVVAVLPQGFESEGAIELTELGATSVNTFRRGVSFQCDLACFYRVNFFARLPYRLLREIARFPCNGPKSLYQEIQSSFDWRKWFNPSLTFRVNVSGYSTALNHSHFTALQVKNALIDMQARIWGTRSSVNLENPDVCFNLHLYENEAVLSLDSSSRSLHKRGYRAAIGIAPLKENLAAGLIQKSHWNPSLPLVDPLCGSGTFLIESAYIALQLPPGLKRTFLIKNWFDFDHDVWLSEKAYAQNQNNNKDYSLINILGCEENTEIASQAQFNVKSSGLNDLIRIQNTHFRDLELPNENGFLICNPPYGKRLGNQNKLISLYHELGKFCKKKASGWELWILSGNPGLTKFLGMKASSRIPINNGGIDCRWLCYKIN